MDKNEKNLELLKDIDLDLLKIEYLGLPLESFQGAVERIAKRGYASNPKEGELRRFPFGAVDSVDGDLKTWEKEFRGWGWKTFDDPVYKFIIACLRRNNVNSLNKSLTKYAFLSYSKGGQRRIVLHPHSDNDKFQGIKKEIEKEKLEAWEVD